MNSDIRFKVIFSKEARTFLAGLPEKARRKIIYIANGEIDSELFKKLDGSDI